MMSDFKIPEILSPAGNFEKLQAALRFGADAVYLAGQRFGMRSAADNFTNEELCAAVEYTHARGKKLYLTCNTMPHPNEYADLRKYLTEIAPLGIDAYIVADLGVMSLLREIDPRAEIHISTQASIVSAEAARAYIALGAKRIVLARELTLEEIREIRRGVPEDIELEAFVHGSMCVSYSGRCLLSQMFTGRDANRGACTQPCRWEYTTVAEVKRPDEPIDIMQNENGSFIMSSKDMCMIEHIPELIEAGISSFKIEGRMKSAYYTAVVTNAYRMALDAACRGEAFDGRLYDELCSVSHRDYATGFYYDKPMDDPKLCENAGYIREKAYLSMAEDMSELLLPEGLIYENENGRLYAFRQRNKVSVGDEAQILTPGRCGRPFSVTELYAEDGTPIESAPHPKMLYFARVPFEVRPGDIMRA